MLYLNQLEHRDVHYLHKTDDGGAAPEKQNVASAGCGLCALCMIVEHLTLKELPLTECVALSEQNRANRKAGTNMLILAPIVAEKFNLDYRHSECLEDLVAHLRDGGEAVVHVKGNGADDPGLFTLHGHYVTALYTDGKDVCILDPSYKEGKFDTPRRRGKVTVDPPFIYCPLDTLHKETVEEEGKSKYHLFKRKKPHHAAE
jgi:hypothetical protein